MPFLFVVDPVGTSLNTFRFGNVRTWIQLIRRGVLEDLVGFETMGWPEHGMGMMIGRQGLNIMYDQKWHTVP